MTDLLASTLERFLLETRHGVVIEEEQIIFDLDSARFSISAERGRCLLHLWSTERNIVREVVDAEIKKDTLRLSVRKFAQSRPHLLRICRELDQRTPAARKTSRALYARVLENAIRKEFPEWNLAEISTGMNLERGFSPVYTRALLRKGRASLAVLGVNRQETQAAVDAALSFGLLWLEYCRQQEAGRSSVEGLRIYVPTGKSGAMYLRMAYLNPAAGRFQLYELEEVSGGPEEKKIAPLDGAAVHWESRIQQCADAERVLSQFADAGAQVRSFAPDAETVILSPLEVSFRLNGLEFARGRIANESASFRTIREIVFGMAGIEAVLVPENAHHLQALVERIRNVRYASGDKRAPLWRIYPERWLESLVLKDVSAVDSCLDGTHVYSQVPAFSAADRSLIDVLTCTHEGRLAVLELKADEDMHLPLQGLDYWARVLWHHARGEFRKFGYFSDVNLSSGPPQLFLVAPALRVHPAVEVILRYFSPEVDWRLVGIDERWRDGIRVVFRKRRAGAMSA
jgi:hypothetical protein